MRCMALSYYRRGPLHTRVEAAYRRCRSAPLGHRDEVLHLPVTLAKDVVVAAIAPVVRCPRPRLDVCSVPDRDAVGARIARRFEAARVDSDGVRVTCEVRDRHRKHHQAGGRRTERHPLLGQ